MVTGQILSEVGDVPETVHFPSSAVVSIITVMRGGRSAESHKIDREAGSAC